MHFLVWQYRLSDEERADCFTCILAVLWIGLLYVSLLRGTLGSSVICDCGISWPYSLVLKPTLSMFVISR